MARFPSFQRVSESPTAPRAAFVSRSFDVADLYGGPVPLDHAAETDGVRLAERQRQPHFWIAEVLGRIFECPHAAWYPTANDDAGGGADQVIEALRDRIDGIVQALSFNPRFLHPMMLRIEGNGRSEEVAPREIVFEEDEIARMVETVRGLAIPPEIRRRIERRAGVRGVPQAAWADGRRPRPLLLPHGRAIARRLRSVDPVGGVPGRPSRRRDHRPLSPSPPRLEGFDVIQTVSPA